MSHKKNSRESSFQDNSDIIVHSQPDGQNPLREERESRRLVWTKYARMVIALAIVLILLIFMAILLQTDLVHQPITFAEYLEKVGRRLHDLSNILVRGINTNGILYTICTFLIAALTGAALSSCGAIYQGVFRNPMASPGLLGVQSGGLLGGVLYILFFMREEVTYTAYTQGDYVRILNEMTWLQRNIQQVWIFAGCLLGALLVVGISQAAGRGRMSTVVLFLTGFMFASISGVITALAQYYMLLHDSGTSRVLAIQTISMGSFNAAYKPEHLLVMSIIVLPVLMVLMAIRHRLNAMVLGEDEAQSMGVNTGRLRIVTFALCTLMVGVTVAFVGQIAFIGLIVPHIARQLAGADYGELLPVSALSGAVIMVFIYYIACLIGFASTINVVTSSVGGVIFLIFMMKHRRARNADWA